MNELKSIIDKLTDKFKGIKIILSEITPRNDDKDEAVIEFNKQLFDIYDKKTDIFLVYHHNLRDNNYSKHYDEKHIHKRAVPLFASNIKKALRKAYGIEKQNYIRYHQTSKVLHPDPNLPSY